MDTVIGVIFPYVAAVLFLLGAIVRVTGWMTAPRKLNWKLYPVPEGLAGEASYILEEWLSFKTLFKNNRVVWLGSYAFHLSLVALAAWFAIFLLGVHLPWLVRGGAWVLLGSSLYLLIARLWMPQLRAMSTPVEYFNLLLFILISLTGVNLMGQELSPQVRAYFIGLISLSPIPPPSSKTFLLNLFLLEFFAAYLPFSKMFHVASKYFAFHKLRWSNPYEAHKRSV